VPCGRSHPCVRAPLLLTGPTIARARRPRRSTFGQDRNFNRLFAIEALQRTARDLRQEVTKIRARDIVDWADWFVVQERSLTELRRSVLDGTYTPSPPSRYESPKRKGAYRTITVPSIRDMIVYRHIADEALRRGLSGKVEGAFFSRRFGTTPVGPTFSLDPGDPYHKFFQVWLAYNQYRSKTLLNTPFDILVITDISNYFDSIQHDLLLEYLTPLGLPRKSIGLLGRLLEAFKPRSGHSPNPRVGIPADELDASRELAHLFLFEHDRRVTRQVGEARYVRWMDDQNIGARSENEARRVVNLLTRSLNSQLLTLNAGKTMFLGPAEVVEHFQLEANEQLEAWSSKWGYPRRPVDPISRRELRAVWKTIRLSKAAGRGNWDKVLKRVYGLAVHVDIRDLEGRALDDLVAYPELDERIFLYFARRSRPRGLIDLFKAYVRAEENLFESTENAFFEAVLLLNPTGKELVELRSLAKNHARFTATKRPRSLPRASAVFALYWLGATAKDVATLYQPEDGPLLPKEVARAWLATCFALDPASVGDVRRSLLGHPSDDVARLSRYLAEIESGLLVDIGKLPGKRSRWPLPGEEFDARAWLTLEILSQAGSSLIRNRVKGALPHWKRNIHLQRERRIAERIDARVA
jgi:reverse transcriptase-like protein